MDAVQDVDDFITDEDFERDAIFDPEVAAEAAKTASQNASVTNAAVEAHLRRMKQAYVAVFESGNPTRGDLEFVLKDLFWFVQGGTHYFADARLQDVMAGRKQVLQRIVEYTRFDFTTLHKMYVEAQK